MLFQPAEQLRIDHPNYAILGYVNRNVFEVSHFIMKDGNYTVGFIGDDSPSPIQPYDLTFTASVRLYVNNSMVVAAPHGFVAAVPDITKDEGFADVIVGEMIKVVSSIAMNSLATGAAAEDFQKATPEEKNTMIGQLTDQLMNISTHGIEVRRHQMERAAEQQVPAAPMEMVAARSIDTMVKEQPVADEKEPESSTDE